MKVDEKVLERKSRFDFALWKNIVQQTMRNKSTASQIIDIEHHDPYASEQERESDTFLLLKIAEHNSMAFNDERVSRLGYRYGLWLHASHTKQSCVPNTGKGVIGDLLVVRATRDIKKDEEIFAQYIPRCDEYDHHKAQLKMRYNIECDCILCEADSKAPQEINVRQSLAESLQSEWRESALAVKDRKLEAEIETVITNGEKLIKKMSATYDDSVYTDGLPRRLLIGPLYWSIQLHGMLGKSPKRAERALRAAKELLGACGFKVEINGPGDVSFENVHGVQLQEAEQALQTCVNASVTLGQMATARRFAGFARELHKQEYEDDAYFGLELSIELGQRTASLAGLARMFPEQFNTAMRQMGLEVDD